ncbi:MAG: hypothetical protein IJK18_09535 [Clostridia bacterium]|nr:hypothetical protein [Clostridia bacterium]
MKAKILPFIIGLLVGAIIATGGFLIYQKNNKHQGPGRMNGQRPQMVQRQDGNSTDGKSTNANSTDGNIPPALPNGEQPNGEAHSQDGQTQNNSETTSTTTNS